MTDGERTPAPRRSTREKKPAQQYAQGKHSSPIFTPRVSHPLPDVNATPTKRKRVAPGADADDDLTDVPPEVAGDDEESQEDDYVAPRRKTAAAKGKGKARGPPAPKKPRAAKTAPKTPTRRPRKVNGTAPKTVAKGPSDAKIANDNALFSTCFYSRLALKNLWRS
jgi:cohesin complex subunit SA-1/2